MKRICLLLCAIILSMTLFACRDDDENTFPDGVNFSEHQRNFYNDTINDIDDFLDLSDETLGLSYDINGNLQLLLRISKNNDIIFSKLIAQGIFTQQEAGEFIDNCTCQLDFSIRKIPAETEEDRIGFTVFCFKNEQSATNFYDWTYAKDYMGTTITLGKNMVMMAYGNLSYDEAQIKNSINYLKENWQVYKFSLSGGNFSELQRNFHNDTIDKVNSFLNLTDETLYLFPDINENLQMGIQINKIDGVYLAFSGMVAQGILVQEDVNGFNDNCLYRLEFGIKKIPADTINNSSIGFIVFCFKDSKTAEDFYKWAPARFLFTPSVTLSENKVLYAYGNLSYDKNQIISSLNDLKENQ